MHERKICYRVDSGARKPRGPKDTFLPGEKKWKSLHLREEAENDL